MKHLGLILIIASLFLGACGQQNKQKKQNPPNQQNQQNQKKQQKQQVKVEQNGKTIIKFNQLNKPNQPNQSNQPQKSDQYSHLTPEEHYHAVLNDTMTLKEVAKINNIGVPFLKTKLGIPNSISYDYQLKQLKRNFRFTLNDLRKYIEDAKSRTASFSKERKNRQKRKK